MQHAPIMSSVHHLHRFLLHSQRIQLPAISCSVTMTAARKTLVTSISTPLHTSFVGSQALWWPCSYAAANNAPPAPSHASTQQPKVVVLFVPGNPGLVGY